MAAVIANAMSLLALETSTDCLSVALSGGRGCPEGGWVQESVGGVQASHTLIPIVLDLLARSGQRLQDLQAIAFGAGPGSFTGLRTACSVAQGLALGAGVNVLPIDTLLGLAEAARAQSGAGRVLVALDARMDEVYSALWRFDGNCWQCERKLTLTSPENMPVPADPDWLLAGNAAGAYGERLPPAPGVLALRPDARALIRLAPALMATDLVPPDQALPHYVRDKVARTTAEREAAAAGAP